MTDKPDDVPEWAWDAAEEPSQACFDASVDLYETGMETANVQLIVARAIIQARSQAYEECAKIAEKERRTDLALKHGYKPSWYVVAQEIAAAIRSKANQ